MSHGYSELQVIVAGSRPDLVAALHAAGWPATSSEGIGVSGPVTMVMLTVSDTEVDRVVELVAALTPDAFWSLRPARSMSPSTVLVGSGLDG